jgi:hydroxymethylpyrimidine/phosphomethylpyrimidine kinase
MVRPIVLAIAGSDSCGGAGVQADLKAIEANGAWAATAIAAITAQNTRGVRAAAPVDPVLLRAQIDAVLDDLDVAAIKTGMLADEHGVAAVADALAVRAPRPLVCDPVMVSKSGHRLLSPAAVAVLRERLLPLSTVVTPNVAETEALSGTRIRDVDDAVRAAEGLLDAGAIAVVVTGGHLEAAPGTDVLVTRSGTTVIAGPMLDARHTHGTGCVFASALAARLGHGDALEDAVRTAKRFVTEAIRRGVALGHGIGPTDPLFALVPFDPTGRSRSAHG